jgi:hypothetical protein
MKPLLEKTRSNKTQTLLFRRGVALVLCLLAPLSGAGFSQDNRVGTGDMAGRVTGVASTATRNGARISVKDTIQTNAEISTDSSGRIAIELQDGSILSAGTGTRFVIDKLDPQTSATAITLNRGRLRSRVAKLRGSGKFEVRTPQATIMAMGTDFFVDVSPDSTELLVYSGVVIVSSATTLPDSTAKLMLDVAAGQDVLINARGIGELQMANEALEQQTMAATVVPQQSTPTVAQAVATPAKSSHATRNILIGGLAAGAVIGAVVGLRGSKSQQSATSIPSVPTIPAH